MGRGVAWGALEGAPLWYVNDMQLTCSSSRSAHLAGHPPLRGPASPPTHLHTFPPTCQAMESSAAEHLLPDLIRPFSLPCLPPRPCVQTVDSPAEEHQIGGAGEPFS